MCSRADKQVGREKIKRQGCELFVRLVCVCDAWEVQHREDQHKEDTGRKGGAAGEIVVRMSREGGAGGLGRT